MTPEQRVKLNTSRRRSYAKQKQKNKLTPHTPEATVVISDLLKHTLEGIENVSTDQALNTPGTEHD
jgi:hypothetical protein